MNRPIRQPFWDFSVAVYGRPGVADACLRLQDRLGLDVNLLLFGCWVGVLGGGRVEERDWKRLIGETSAWRAETVEPLRAIRRRLKTASWPGIDPAAASALREAVMQLELEAERLEQLAVGDLCPVSADVSVSAARRSADAVANAMCYAAVLGTRPAACDRADMEMVAVSAACDKM